MPNITEQLLRDAVKGWGESKLQPPPPQGVVAQGVDRLAELLSLAAPVSQQHAVADRARGVLQLLNPLGDIDVAGGRVQLDPLSVAGLIPVSKGAKLLEAMVPLYSDKKFIKSLQRAFGLTSQKEGSDLLTDAYIQAAETVKTPNAAGMIDIPDDIAAIEDPTEAASKWIRYINAKNVKADVKLAQTEKQIILDAEGAQREFASDVASGPKPINKPGQIEEELINSNIQELASLHEQITTGERISAADMARYQELRKMLDPKRKGDKIAALEHGTPIRNVGSTPASVVSKPVEIVEALPSSLETKALPAALPPPKAGNPQNTPPYKPFTPPSKKYAELPSPQAEINQGEPPPKGKTSPERTLEALKAVSAINATSRELADDLIAEGQKVPAEVLRHLQGNQYGPGKGINAAARLQGVHKKVVQDNIKTLQETAQGTKKVSPRTAVHPGRKAFLDLSLEQRDKAIDMYTTHEGLRYAMKKYARMAGNNPNYNYIAASGKARQSGITADILRAKVQEFLENITKVVE